MAMSDDQNTPADPDPDDPTPAGDTKEHSSAAESGPDDGPGPAEPGGNRYKRDPVGGEAEAETTIEVD